MALTPELIQGKLFSFYVAAQKLHLDTRSYAEHKALGKLYEGLAGYVDELRELLMGYQNGKRIGKGKIEELPTYSSEAVSKLMEDGCNFAYELYEWAGDKKYCDLENKAQELSGLFAKTKYLLTLS